MAICCHLLNCPCSCPDNTFVFSVIDVGIRLLFLNDDYSYKHIIQQFSNFRSVFSILFQSPAVNLAYVIRACKAERLSLTCKLTNSQSLELCIQRGVHELLSFARYKDQLRYWWTGWGIEFRVIMEGTGQRLGNPQLGPPEQLSLLPSQYAALLVLSICLSVQLSVLYMLFSRKQKGIEKKKIAWTFPRVCHFSVETVKGHGYS